MQKGIKNLTGKTIETVSGNKFVLGSIIGRGAQGVVYSEAGGKYLIKLYYPSGSTELDNRLLEKLSFVKRVKKPKNFIEIKDLINMPYTGYVMERIVGHKSLNTYLIPPQNEPFPQWYNSGLGLRERLILGYVIAKAFNQLSESNLSYCDISGNNILVRIDNKGVSVRMIDVDNIYVAGNGQSLVMGTPRYIAPEVIKGKNSPDVFSDNYSLAVILFELLRVGHPYVSDEIADGTPEQEEAAYAGEYDYVNDSNSSNMLPESAVFTTKLSDLFNRCFCGGKTNRMLRPSAKEFEDALLDASNKIIKCPSCGAWHYPRKENKTFLPCPWCGEKSVPKSLLNFYDRLYDKDTEIRSKNLTTYFLRGGKNLIKGLYVCRCNEGKNSERTSENFLTIVQTGNKCVVYNEFCKKGIVVKSFRDGTLTMLGERKDYVLSSGDEIYFYLDDGQPFGFEVGKEKYKFVRIAKFVER